MRVAHILPGRNKTPFPALRLSGERVILRPPAPVDWQDWTTLRARSRDHLIPFEPAWPEEALSQAYFLHKLERQARFWALGFSCSFLVFKTDMTLAGGINMNNITRGAAQFCSLGYWLGAEHQGQGYMGEALRLVLAYGFDSQKLHRVNAATQPHNGRSIKLLRRNGFEEEGFAKAYIQINNQWQDHVLFGITGERFRKTLHLNA